jgi:hypothetical protein
LLCFFVFFSLRKNRAPLFPLIKKEKEAVFSSLSHSQRQVQTRATTPAEIQKTSFSFFCQA